MSNTFFIARGRIPVSGFETLEPLKHVDRIERPYKQELRVLVAGSRNTPGFGLGYIDSDLWRNDGPGRPRLLGANLYGFGHAGVISGDGRGTGWEIEQARSKGLLLEAEIDDLFIVEDPHAEHGATFWALKWDGWSPRSERWVDRHNIKFVPVGLAVPSVEQAAS